MARNETACLCATGQLKCRLRDVFALIEYPFPWRNAEQGLELFPPELQQDPLVYYHGTLAINGESIARTGFEVPKGHRGVSFAQKSRDSLIWALNRDTERRGAVVMAVRFGARPQPRGGGGECGLGMAVAGRSKPLMVETRAPANGVPRSVRYGHGWRNLGWPYLEDFQVAAGVQGRQSKGKYAHRGAFQVGAQGIHGQCVCPGSDSRGFVPSVPELAGLPLNKQHRSPAYRVGSTSDLSSSRHARAMR